MKWSIFAKNLDLYRYSKTVDYCKKSWLRANLITNSLQGNIQINISALLNVDSPLNSHLISNLMCRDNGHPPAGVMCNGVAQLNRWPVLY